MKCVLFQFDSQSTSICFSEDIPEGNEDSNERIKSLRSDQIFSVRPEEIVEYNIDSRAETLYAKYYEKTQSTLEMHAKKFDTYFSRNAIATRSETYPKIVFLGTGSGRPRLFRNSTGILVHLT